MAGVKGEKQNAGLVISMTEFDSAQFVALAQPGPEGLQAEGVMCHLGDRGSVAD